MTSLDKPTERLNDSINDFDPINALTYPDGPPTYEQDSPLTGGAARSLREVLRLSQDWVADQVDVPRRSYVRWETSDNPIKPDVAAYLYAVTQEAEGIIFSIAEDYLSGARTAPLTTWHTDEAYREHGGAYQAAWHRAICGRIVAKLAERDQAHLCPVYYADRPLPEDNPKAVGERVVVADAINQALLVGGQGMLSLGDLTDKNRISYEVRLMAAAKKMSSLSEEDRSIVKTAVRALTRAKEIHRGSGRWSRTVWLPDYTDQL